MRSKEQTLAMRKKYLGRSLSLAYNEPLKIVRGKGQYLYDENLENNSEFGLSGFSALPESSRSNGSGNYELQGKFAFFWSSSQTNSDDSNCGNLYSDCVWYLILSGFY